MSWRTSADSADGEPADTTAIKALVYLNGKRVAEITLTKTSPTNYSVRVAVQTDTEVKMYQRALYNLDSSANVLGAIMSALTALPEEAFLGGLPINESKVYRTLAVDKNIYTLRREGD